MAARRPESPFKGTDFFRRREIFGRYVSVYFAILAPSLAKERGQARLRQAKACRSGQRRSVGGGGAVTRGAMRRDRLRSR